MVDTFRGRDPRTGGTIISDRTRVPDGGGLTQRERDAFAGTGEFNRGAMQSVNRPSGAMSYQEFLSSTGRSDTDSFGNTGRLKNLNPNYTKTTPGGAATIRMGNELAYDKYLNPRTDGQLRPFRPNDLIFEQGITQIARPAPSQGGIMGLSPTVALLKSLFGIGGVQFEPLVDADPLDNPAAAPPAPVEAPIPAASTVGAQQPSGFILASTMPREDNGIFNLPLDQLRKIPETGIGGFIEQSKDGFQVGPGKLKPEFNVNDGSFGLTFKIPIAANPNFSLPPNPELETEAEYKARKDKLINQARMDKYLEGQSDVGVYTPPIPPTTYQEGMTLLPDLRDSQQQQYGGFADVIRWDTIRHVEPTEARRAVE